jgi:putative transposase
MYKVEQHQIRMSSPEWLYCCAVTKDSAILYNAAQSLSWTSWIYGHGALSQAFMDKAFQSSEEYQILPAKVSQLVLKQVADSWQSYFKSLKTWKTDPSKYKAKPKPPGCIDGLNLVKFNTQAISKTAWKKGLIQPSMSPLSIPVKPGLTFDQLVEVRIIPKTGCFNVEVVYDDGLEHPATQTEGIGAAIDLGLDNLAMITFSDPTIQPIAINGKPLKSMNQWANKLNARYRALLPEGQDSSKRLEHIWRKRNNRVKDYLHQSTKRIVDELVALNVVCVGIGKNEGWKDSINIGRKNNQKFVTIPHAQFIDMLTRKLKAVGIAVKVGEESYTSRASYLDWDIIPTYQSGNAEKPMFSGRRVKTKSYRSGDGSLLNADVNGSGNIGRKVIPNYFGEVLRAIIERDRGSVVAFPRRVDSFKMMKRKDMSRVAYV